MTDKNKGKVKSMLEKLRDISDDLVELEKDVKAEPEKVHYVSNANCCIEDVSEYLKKALI